MFPKQMPERRVSKQTLKVWAISISGLLGIFFVACSRDEISVVSEEKNETVELIGQLGDRDELTRTRAFQQLPHYLVVETDAPEFSERLTLFHKHAPHACKAEHEEQTLHILDLFELQRDISSILLKQCLLSKHSKVRAKALGLAHFSDNSIGETLLAFDPDPDTLGAYTLALVKLGTPAAEQRLVEIFE